MSDLKIVGWSNFECEFPSKKLTDEEFIKVLKLIQDEIYEKGYIFSGEEHQYSSTGVPVLSDGTCVRCSMRCFGAIMASVYVGPDGKRLSYMDFYMSLDNSVLPEESNINIVPMNIESYPGLMIKEDNQLVSEALSFGMPLMTTDKVLKKIMENMKRRKPL